MRVVVSPRLTSSRVSFANNGTIQFTYGIQGPPGPIGPQGEAGVAGTVYAL